MSHTRVLSSLPVTRLPVVKVICLTNHQGYVVVVVDELDDTVDAVLEVDELVLVVDVVEVVDSVEAVVDVDDELVLVVVVVLTVE